MSEAAVPVEDFGYRNLRMVADRLLETTRVEYVDEGVLLIMNPPGIEHRRIVGDIVDSAKRAFYTGVVPVNWRVMSENYQWDVSDGSGRFFIPDLVLIHPDATSVEEERGAIALIVEVTSPTSPDTVLNDRTTKPVEYAKAGVPLYLLVDQELAKWTLFGLAEGWQRYQVVAAGAYGDEIGLPAPLGFPIETAAWPRWR
jgi:Uma2 family endonuclease